MASNKVKPNESVELQGNWWLPSSPDHKVGGVFTWDPEEGGILELWGRLDPEGPAEGGGVVVVTSSSDIFGPGDHPVIHGETSEGHFTLLDAVSRAATKRFSRAFAYSQTWSVNSAVFGDALFDDVDRPAFVGVSFSLRNLTAWVGESGIARSVKLPDARGFQSLAVTATRLDDMAVQTDGYNLRLWHRIAENLRGPETIELSQWWYWALDSDEPRTLKELLDVVVDLQQLVTIATGQTADIMASYLYIADADASATTKTLAYLGVWANRTEPSKRKPPKTLNFVLNDFGGLEGVARWLAVASTYRTEITRVMGTRHNKAMSLDDRILAMCAALESFDIERRQTGKKKVDYLDRVRETHSWAGRPFVDSDEEADAWAKTVRDVRNDLAHHRSAVRRNETKASKTLDLQLYWVLAIGFLRLAGAPDNLLTGSDAAESDGGQSPLTACAPSADAEGTQ